MNPNTPIDPITPPVPSPEPVPQPTSLEPVPTAPVSAPTPVPAPFGEQSAPALEPLAPAPAPMAPVPGPIPAPSPVPPAAPMAPGAPMMSSAPAAPSSGPKISKKLWIILSAVVGGLLVVGAVLAVLFVFVFNSGVKLTTYENDKFSILIPDDDTYKVKEASSGVQVSTEDEKNGGLVSVSLAKLPSGWEDVMSEDELLSNTEKSFGTSLGSILSTQDSQDATYKGSKAKILTGELKDGDATGKVKAIVFVKDNAVVIVMVASKGPEGTKLWRSADKIFDSFTLK